MPSADPSAAGGAADETPDTAPDDPPVDPGGPSGGLHAFPRDARLLDGRGYDAVFADNRRVADRYWTVLAHRPRPAAASAPSGQGGGGTPSARLGLAIAKKRARRAVDRNRIKRIARESFRHARASLDGRHVVVMNRDPAAAASSAELRVALDALWRRLLRQSPARPDKRQRVR